MVKQKLRSVVKIINTVFEDVWVCILMIASCFVVVFIVAFVVLIKIKLPWER